MRPQAHAIAHASQKVISYVSTTEKDISNVVAFVNAEYAKTGKVLRITTEEVGKWVEQNLSIVAKNAEGDIVGHMAIGKWPNGWAECRAIVVDGNYEGNGIFSKLVAKVLGNAVEHGDIRILCEVFTVDNHKVKDIFQRKLGFKPVPIDEVPPEILSYGTPEGKVPKETWGVVAISVSDYLKSREEVKNQVAEAAIGVLRES